MTYNVFGGMLSLALSIYLFSLLPKYTAWWQKRNGVNSLHKVMKQCSTEIWTCNPLISSRCYCQAILEFSSVNA